jgi:two-component system, LytTR family, response regulator
MNTITLPYHHKKLPVEADEIIKLEGAGNYTLFYLTNGRQILTSKSLVFYEELLSFPFVRVHKSCLVNIHYATHRTTPTLLTLSDGSEVPVARRRKATVKQYIEYKRKPKNHLQNT